MPVSTFEHQEGLGQRPGALLFVMGDGYYLSNTNKLRKSSIAFATILLVLCSALLVFEYVQYQIKKTKYENFLEAERNAIPILDQLNSEVAQSLPPLPPGSLLVKTGSNGSDMLLYRHGRWLDIDFSSDEKPEFILYYYRSSLVNAGWVRLPSAYDNDYYVKGISCIRITPPSYTDSYYIIEIWHDFKRNLGAEMPDLDIIYSFEWAKTSFATCQ